MKRMLALIALITLVVSVLAGCGTGDVVMETVGEGVSTDGRPVFYEFFTQG